MARMSIALGCMGMSGAYGKTDDAKSIEVIHAAIERGIGLLDTADFYGSGHNELLIGKAIAGRRDKVRLSVKFGAMRGPDGAHVSCLDQVHDRADGVLDRHRRIEPRGEAFGERAGNEQSESRHTLTHRFRIEVRRP